MNASTDFFESLSGFIGIVPVSGDKTEWTCYQGPDEQYSLQPNDGWPEKIRNVYEIITRLHPETLLDIGCNKGWFSKLALQQGANVISTDIDESSINSLYGHAKRARCKILPLFMDFCRPTPPHGLANAYRDAQSRLRSDMVLALAVTHHLVFKKSLSFEAIAKQLSEFTGKWLLVEFVPADDIHVSKWMNDQYLWYTIDNFIKALEKYYHDIEVIESNPYPRKLVFCSKE